MRWVRKIRRGRRSFDIGQLVDDVFDALDDYPVETLEKMVALSKAYNERVQEEEEKTLDEVFALSFVFQGRFKPRLVPMKPSCSSTGGGTAGGWRGRGRAPQGAAAMVPAEQAVQIDSPALAEYFPASQSLQTEYPASAAIVPAAQSVHAEAAAAVCVGEAMSDEGWLGTLSEVGSEEVVEEGPVGWLETVPSEDMEDALDSYG